MKRGGKLTSNTLRKKTEHDLDGVPCPARRGRRRGEPLRNLQGRLEEKGETVSKRRGRRRQCQAKKIL